MSKKTAGEIVVIYDGACDFCAECVKWVMRRRQVTALPFQTADLARYGVSYERCSKEVVVVVNKKTYGGASAVAQLLKASGHKTLGNLLRLSGPLGRKGYQWVASHRNRLIVRLATRVLRQS